MARKKIIDSDSVKLTLDLSGDNKKVLDEITTNYMAKYGPTINKIIGVFCNMPKGIKKVIENVCVEQYKKLETQIAQTEEAFHKKPLEEERDTYLEILRLLNHGQYEIITENTEEEAMQTIELEDGYLIIPADWIVVNPERAKECRYAAVLECRNSAKFGVPHFIYLNNYRYGCDFTDEMESDFLSQCRKAWPKFKEIEELSNKNQLVPDPNNKGQYLNAEAHLAAPIIGLFSIEEQGENPFDKPPYGAMIVRTETEFK